MKTPRRSFLKGLITTAIAAAIPFSLAPNIFKGQRWVSPRDQNEYWRVKVRMPKGDFMVVTTLYEDSLFPGVREVMMERLRSEYQRELFANI